MSPSQIDGPGFAWRNPAYEARIRRARELAARYPFAAEVLGFYVQVAVFQQNLYKQLRAFAAKQPSMAAENPFRAGIDLVPLMTAFPDFLRLLQSVGTAQITAAARQLWVQGSTAWVAFLGDFWSAGRLLPPAVINGSGGEDASTETAVGAIPSPEGLTIFILHAFLQPCAELYALSSPLPEQSGETRHVCPHCDSAPVAGVLRREGDGAKRFLLCSFCLQEWDYRRILCPACGETEESKLPVYVAEEFPYIRVEACDTCERYIRSIDLTKDGNAIPIVDDLAAIPLSLWAEERGYTRLQPNLLST